MTAVTHSRKGGTALLVASAMLIALIIIPASPAHADRCEPGDFGRLILGLTLDPVIDGSDLPDDLKTTYYDETQPLREQPGDEPDEFCHMLFEIYPALCPANPPSEPNPDPPGSDPTLMDCLSEFQGYTPGQRVDNAGIWAVYYTCPYDPDELGYTQCDNMASTFRS